MDLSLRGKNGGICEEKRHRHLITSQDDFEEHFLHSEVFKVSDIKLMDSNRRLTSINGRIDHRPSKTFLQKKH